MQESKCKCGKTIIWGKTADGKKIPLDKSAPVYVLDIAGNAMRQPYGYYVSHYCTCRFSDEFSLGKK